MGWAAVTGRGLTVAALLGGLAGCAQWAPSPQLAPPEDQQIMESVAHWKGLARTIAAKAQEADAGSQAAGSGTSGYFVRAASPDGPCATGGCPSGFQKGFRKLLKTALLAKGIPVTRDPGSNLVLEYDVQTVRHSWDSADSPFRSEEAADVGPDAFLRDAAEVLVTTSFLRNDRYVLRSSDIFYVREAEAFQYQPGQQRAPREEWARVSYEVVER